MQTQQPHFVLSVPNLDQFTWSVNTNDKTTKTKDVFSINSFSWIPLDGWMDILTDRLDPDLIAAQRTHASYRLSHFNDCWKNI